MDVKIPRLVIGGLSGDSGKTVVSLGLLAGLRQRGLGVSVFKKGPDYIDAAWLGKLAGAVCRNLDTYMVEPDEVYESFVSHAAGADVAVVEGNRGLFDGRDVEGANSTAELAKLLRAPVVLVVGASKTTRTIAAVVKGCQSFCPELDIAGVVLNKVAGKRHERVLTDAIGKYCGLPVLGVVPRMDDGPGLIGSRHLGLVTPAESGEDADLEARLTAIAGHLDVDGLLDAARRAAPLPGRERRRPPETPAKVKVGYFKDTVFTFYYPENLEALEAHGAELVPVSSLDDASLPDIDALYIGGGFPETHAGRLAQNGSMMESVRAAAEGGLPVYAECGGLIYLSRSLTWKGDRCPMAGVFPVDLVMRPRPAGHGYARLLVDRPNPFFEVGAAIKGHEFHYSCLTAAPEESMTCMRVETGTGLGEGRDGLLYKNTMACYTHIHADAVKDWAPRLVASAAVRRGRMEKPLHI
ncbi:MAG: cobyrinate a,c-diamide synthase [Elusimicrobiota bacterium]